MRISILLLPDSEISFLFCYRLELMFSYLCSSLCLAAKMQYGNKSIKEENRSIWLTLNIDNNNAKFGDGYRPGVLLLKEKKIALACFFCLIIYWLKASCKFLPLTINPWWRNGEWRIKLNWFDWTQSVCWNVQYKWQIMNILNIGQGLGMCLSCVRVTII